VEREERKGGTGEDEWATWVCFYRARRRIGPRPG
jgi:hypothetical protein